jgi:hypothetical protein
MGAKGEASRTKSPVGRAEGLGRAGARSAPRKHLTFRIQNALVS